MKSTDMGIRFSTIEEAVAKIKDGGFIVIVDDKDRENEGDLVIAAEFIEPSHIDFYEREARGWICVSLQSSECERLNLPMMVSQNTGLHGTPFTVTVDYRHGTSTGISASDQARTIRALADGYTRPEDFARPGHVRPLKAVTGGVLSRAGHTEAVVDLVRIAGLRPAGVLCEIKKEGGEMARLADLDEYCRRNDFPLITIEDLIEYRLRTEKLVERLIEADLPTPHGTFRAIAYGDALRDEQHLALVHGDISGDEPVMVRVNSECVLGDVFGALVCDCGEQMQKSFEMISREGRGVILYLRHALAGVEMVKWMRYLASCQEGKEDSADLCAAEEKVKHRDYGTGAQILRDLGLKQIKLVTNSDFKMVGLKAYGIEIIDRTPLDTECSEMLDEIRSRFGSLENMSEH